MTGESVWVRGAWFKEVLMLLNSLPVFVVVFIPLSLLYMSTGVQDRHTHIDPGTNAITAWHLGMTSSVVLPEYETAVTEVQHGNVAWIVESTRGPVSQYPPGAAALAAPLYWITGDPMTNVEVQGSNDPAGGSIVVLPLPSPGPAAVAASLSAAAAMGLLAAALPYAGSSRVAAIATGYVGGLGTTMWGTVSESLWQHGPGAMWVALGVYLVARSRLWMAGLAFGAAIITRPHLALIAAGVGIAMTVSRRAVSPLIQVGAGSLAGLVGLLWFNWWLWGNLTISGGYGSTFANRLSSADMLAYGENLLLALVDPAHGLLVYSPFLLFLVPGLREGWRRVPGWAKGAAVGGVAYLLVQLKANRFSGGDGFLGYRYPIEALTAAGVLLTAAYTNWVNERPFVRRLFWLGFALALVPQIAWKALIAPVRGVTVNSG